MCKIRLRTPIDLDTEAPLRPQLTLARAARVEWKTIADKTGLSVPYLKKIASGARRDPWLVSIAGPSQAENSVLVAD